MLRNRHHSILFASIASCLLMAPDNGAPAGGGGTPSPATPPPLPKGTLEEQLSQANSDLATLRGTVGTLTTERDDLRSQFDSLTSTSQNLTKERDAAQSELVTAREKINSLTGERDRAVVNVGRLETLCDLKGIDKGAAVPTSDAPAAGGEAHVYDQWANATGAEKSVLYHKHKSEIRAEGDRRAKSGR